MHYTLAPEHATHPATGNRMHQDTGPVTSMVTADDMNQLTWELMEVIKAAGISPIPFDPDTPASYGQVLAALNALYSGNGDVGDVKIVAANTPPAGWLKMNGASLSTTTFAALFARIGYTFGGSGGAFLLPDTRGEFVRGWDDSRGVDAGRAFGSAQADELRSHKHALATLSDGEGSFGWEQAGYGSHSVDTSFTGGSETRPRNIALLFCIKY